MKKKVVAGLVDLRRKRMKRVECASAVGILVLAHMSFYIYDISFAIRDLSISR